MKQASRSDSLMRVNIGCGRTPTAGWQNFDASPSVFLARVPCSDLWIQLAQTVGLLDSRQIAFAQFCRSHNIKHANALRRIPLASQSCSVVYASHVLEHLSREDEVPRFLAEARRLLVKGGTLRLAVPDLNRYVRDYLSDGDADAFVRNLHLARAHRPHGIRGVIARVLNDRSFHRWVYDERSLIASLVEAGFHSVQRLPAGVTTIPEPGDLDLRERSWESLYLEAVN